MDCLLSPRACSEGAVATIVVDVQLVTGIVVPLMRRTFPCRNPMPEMVMVPPLAGRLEGWTESA